VAAGFAAPLNGSRQNRLPLVLKRGYPFPNLPFLFFPAFGAVEMFAL
jgi:hypothetical protein